MKISRRDFLKGGAATAISAAMAGVMTVPAFADNDEGAKLTSEMNAIIADSNVELGAIKDFAKELDYDVVVVGAGTTGIPAALAAYQAGAKVAVLQKGDAAVAQGMLVAAVIKDKSTEIGMKQYIHYNHALYDYHNDPSLWQRYVDCSQEAVDWFVAELDATGFDNYVMDNDNMDHVYDDGNCYIRGVLFKGSMQEPCRALAEAYAEKIDFYYSTPAVQLVRKDGKVLGVIGKDADGNYIKLNTKKGVILATGDYQNNDAMVLRYCPDAAPFRRGQIGKTGDGHLLAMLAGGQMEKSVHSKMIHGTSPMRNEPFLAVNSEGKRFAEEDVKYERRNTVLRNVDGLTMWSLFDANYADYVYGWGSDPTTPTTGNASPEKLAAAVENGTVLMCDTIDELAEKMKVDAEALKTTVDRYNELCAMGMDLDFGKPSKYMKPVDTAPFYAIRRSYYISAIPAGVLINDKGQVLDSANKPIEGLYAAGNCSGCFYGDIDYSLDTMGLSVGRCVTFGYITGKEVAEK